MNSPTTQFVTSRRLGIYEPLQQINTWGDFSIHGCSSSSAFGAPELDTGLDNQSEDASHGILMSPNKFELEASRPTEKTQRRLAQNREAARKSRLRKKAYVQQLEISRSKLIQLEQELDRVRQQGVYVGGGLDGSPLEFPGNVNSGITAFEMEYKQWLEEHSRHIFELRNALNSNTSDIELRILVDGGLSHYFELFRMKATAAEGDIFYLMSGMWKTSAERFFSWIGGFRPSETLKVIVPQLEPLTDQQLLDICSLKESCQQAEDAVSQGMEKLQQTLAESVASGQLGEGSYIPQMSVAMENLDSLVRFVNQYTRFSKQADHLRQETLLQMSRILTIRQAARGLLALGEYSQRLRALSNLWATRPGDPS